MKRFWDKVEKTESCWLWKACTLQNGYGQFGLGGKRVLAHRLSYQLTKGDIPDGLQIDHLCRVRHCVNPQHLEAVTPRTNLLRGTGTAAVNARKTHCPQGHEYNEENTIYRSYKINRVCRTCLKAQKVITGARYRAKRRALQNA